MIPTRYRRRPTEVEAVLLLEVTSAEALAWVFSSERFATERHEGIEVETIEGNTVLVPWNAYLVKDAKGYFYPCNAELFEANHDEIKPCPDCGGEGFWVATHYVTREMATDAGEPTMEGMPMDEKAPCDRCGGGGVVEGEPQTQEAPF